jgi:UDP-N-acetylglucosamine/UDP-N-acetylgalactosamine diphosphorylase
MFFSKAMNLKSAQQCEILIQQGVRILLPDTVLIGPEVDIRRIAAGSTIHPGCRITGASTLIGEGAVIGELGPATVCDCLVGPGVSLAGGSFEQAVFLEKSSVGPCAHIRAGTILEEMASAAHSVGLKHTILFPFVTLGSLVNFCDCLMAGGTGKKNHSEVGSSYIHFNFTPSQDKATPSLLGDVPKGVMLKQPPIFLGGQGGLVGPCCIAFGTVIAAGCVWRKDVEKPGRLLNAAPGRGVDIPFKSGTYSGLARILNNNIKYLANLAALGQWYKIVRALFFSGPLGSALHEGLCRQCDIAVDERLKQLDNLRHKASQYLEEHAKNDSVAYPDGKISTFIDAWPDARQAILESIASLPESADKESFLQSVEKAISRKGQDYLAVISSLGQNEADMASAWLSAVAEAVEEKAILHLNFLKRTAQ